MADVLVVLVIVAVLSLAVFAIVKSRRSGKKCIGCPDSCCGARNGCGGCNDCGGCK